MKTPDLKVTPKPRFIILLAVGYREEDIIFFIRPQMHHLCLIRDHVTVNKMKKYFEKNKNPLCRAILSQIFIFFKNIF